MKTLEEKISALGEELGFDLISWTNGEDLNKEIISKKINKGQITSFESRDIEYRTSPSLHLQGVKTIFVFAMSYKWDGEEVGKYGISKYARGLDYHIVMKEKIQDFQKALSKKLDFSYQIQVDTGGLLEKSLALKAGLGGLGKNTLLINKNLGSYLFLGLMLTNIKLKDKVNTPIDPCKSCDKCVKACPTGALLGDRTMEPRKCLSYLSQTKKTYFNTNNLVLAYGCDICQDICPYNKKARSNIHQAFKPRIFSFDENIKIMSNNEFRKKYKDFAFSWISRKLIVRNMEILHGK